MKKHIKYLSYIYRHKLYVFLECCKYGLIWQGIIHDLSKFSPDEWLPYADHFYTDKKNGNAFSTAWVLHIHRNPHHWQFWTILQDDGRTKVLEMPLKYRKEMLADWRGESRAITGFDNVVGWYETRRLYILLGRETKKWIEKELGLL